MKLSTIIATAATARKQTGKLATHPNREGAPSYYRSLEEQVVQVLTCGTLGDTFYASGQQLAKEALEVLLRARAECPEFLARALVYARNQGLMKTLPTLGLVVLSGGRHCCSLFEAIFNQVILIPDDLRAFVALCRAKVVPGRDGLGGMAAKAVKAWLPRMSEYHAVKYGSGQSDGMTLRDILRLSHVKPTDAACAERFGWLVKGKEGLGSDPALNPQIRALEALKQAATEDAQVALIREGRLPYEVVVPTLRATTPAIWSQLLQHAPYFNLLRSLVTFTRHGVFESEANVQHAVARLTNHEAIRRSKVLPFRLFAAWQAYTQGENPDTRLADALRQALEISFVNMPSLGDRTIAIGSDVSGSMNSQVSNKGTTRYIDIAGIFTGALMKRCEGRVIPLPFDTCVHTNHGLSSRDDILVTAEKIQRYCGGGTAVGAPVQHLLDRKIKVDCCIGITDGEDWAYGYGWNNCRDSFLNLWRSYRQKVNPVAQAFLVNIAPYRDAVAPAGEKGVHFISGWSDDVLRYIPLKMESGGSQLTAIGGMSLDVSGVRKDTLADSGEANPDNS